MNPFLAKTFLALSTAAMLGATMLPVAASAGEVRNREHFQQARIDQGVRDGQMTRREYDHTESRLGFINAQRRADLRANGGTLTRGEYHQLNRELNGNSRNIYFDKHNFARQPGAPLI